MDQSSIIQAFRDASLNALDRFARDLIKERLPTDYIQTLNDNDKTDALRACLIIYVLTATVIVPRQFQLEAMLATLDGRDSIITAGTGSGKTLCMIIPILLRPGTVTMTISPLKRLQATQVTRLKCNDFVRMQNILLQVLESVKYGINTLSINEDTPNDPSLWEVIIHHSSMHLFAIFDTYEKHTTRTFTLESSHI